MSLEEILERDCGIAKREVIEDVTEERIKKDSSRLRQVVSFWRAYPDLFIDYLCKLNPNNSFHFFFYQRLYLRAVMRHKYVYCVFPRAYSKSFLAVMCLMIKCILYPGCQIFVVSDGKQQSAAILTEKVQDVCNKIPALSREIKKSSSTKDSAVYTFKNGSTLENIAASEKTRGRRFQSGLVEEAINIDQDILNTVVLPTMNVSRYVNGVVDPDEPLNQSQIFVTTAGYKNSFSYNKLIEILCQSVARPDEAIILGGSWRTPVMEGLLNKNFVQDMKMAGTFNEAAFDREYESKWIGSVEGAFFDSNKFDKHRILQLAESEANGRNNANSYYVLGVDVGRIGCTTEVIVMKVSPAQSGLDTKQVVNIYSFEEEHFGLQAIKIKRLFKKFNCRMAVIDANGLGIGLVDFLVQDQEDPDTGEILYNLGVYNDEDGMYDRFKTENTVRHAMYLMKATISINSELYAYTQNQLATGKLIFLIDENMAKNKLLDMTKSRKMSQSQRSDYLQPYIMTSILREQMLNLVEERDGALIVLKQSSRTIKKDKFSALIYALSWPMSQEKKKVRKTFDTQHLMFFTKH